MITKLDSGCGDCLAHDGGMSFLQARSARLLLPDRPKLFMPERRPRRLSGVPTSALTILDAATLRILLEQVDGMTLSDDQIRAMLFAEFGETHLLDEAFSNRWPGTRLGQIDWLRVLPPSPAPMKWSFEQPTSRLRIGEDAGGRGPADGIYALAPASKTRAPASQVEVESEGSGKPGVCEPIGTTGLNGSRKPRSRRTLASDKRIKAFLRLAVAAIFLVLALPPHVLDTPAPAWTSASSIAPRSRDGFAASPHLLAPIAAPRFEHLTTLTREPSGARRIALAAAPQAILPTKEATEAPVRAVRHTVLSAPVEAPPSATESTGVAPTPPRRPALKRKKTTAAPIDRKRSDIATLVMPDILRPQ